jgi:hypothetical protein
MSDSTFLQMGEELTYEVSWSFIKLGTIRAKMLHRTGKGTKPRYTVICYIDSYAGLVVASLHTIFESSMDNDCYSDSFISWEKDGKRWTTVSYRFDREKNRLISEEGVSQHDTGKAMLVQKRDTLSVDEHCLDGLSMLYFARANVSSGKAFTVPTVIQGKQGTTVFNFYGKQTSAKIDAAEYPVSVIEFDGNAQYSGVFGLSGPFKGWFSNDGAHVPIKGKLKVILGSVTVELIKWQRTGWNPPQYNAK